ncbi:MAG: hypothetical protein AB1646_22780 [Thermodesulfobacteriota bacterium]
MPPESDKRSRKAPGRRRSVLAILVIGVLTALMCDAAIGQQPPFMQPPYYLPPQRPAMSRGLFYMNAGVKYRNIQEVSFKSRDTQIINIAQPGVPAFGPGVDELLNYPVPPTSIASDPPSISGIWLYDDGFLEPTPFITQAPAPQFFFPFGHQGLGRVGVGRPDDAGTWMVTDLRAQADDGAAGNMAATQHFRFTKVLDGLTPNTYAFILAQPGAAGTTLALGPAAGTPYGVAGVWAEVPSRGFAAVVASGLDKVGTLKTVVPYVEAGLQVTNYFDLFGGFSWIPISKDYGRTVPATVFAARRAYRDTFPFHSDPNTTATPTWPANALFWSGSADPAATVFPQAEIWPYGATDSYGRLPYRRFFNVLDPAGPAFEAQETLRSTLDATAYEMRVGARSWFPLNAQGRFGTTFGFLFTPLAYQIDTSAEFVATAPETTFAVSAGQTLASYTSTHRDIRWNYGLFVGTELELGSYNYFIKGGADYNYYFNTTSYGEVVLTTINVGGFSATLALGRRF